MTLQIGVIGCGAIGQDHVRRMYQTLSGARVVAGDGHRCAAGA